MPEVVENARFQIVTTDWKLSEKETSVAATSIHTGRMAQPAMGMHVARRFAPGAMRPFLRTCSAARIRFPRTTSYFSTCRSRMRNILLRHISR